MFDRIRRVCPSDLLKRLAGPGFRDTTRIAKGSPQMWEDIFFENSEELMKSMDAFLDVLYEARRALLHDDHDALRDVLTNAVRARRSFDAEDQLD